MKAKEASRLTLNQSKAGESPTMDARSFHVDECKESSSLPFKQALAGASPVIHSKFRS